MRIDYATVFCALDRRDISGNTAAVIVADRAGETFPDSDQQKLAISQRVLCDADAPGFNHPTVVCFVCPSDNNTLAIECFNRSQKIKRCGHGSLAAHAAYQPAEQNGLHWLAMPIMASQNVDLPDWLSQAFDQTPGCAAQAGDANDYLILEWPAEQSISADELTLKRLQVNFEAISQHTQRAIIATQWAGKNGIDFYQRYFAPQHGVNEDSATGSAHAVLARYWQQKRGQDQFIARQCSNAGGILHSKIQTVDNTDRLWIGGQVKIQHSAAFKL